MLLQSIIAPEPGLFIWTTIIFVVFFFLLRAFAWKPILSMIHEREERISSALEDAEEARNAMARIQAESEALMKEARAERDKLLSEAKETVDAMVKEGRAKAAAAAELEVEKGRQQIDAERVQALNQIKETAANLAVEVSEKILRKQFQDKATQESFASQLISDIASDN